MLKSVDAHAWNGSAGYYFQPCVKFANAPHPAFNQSALETPA